MEQLNEIIAQIDDFVWGPVMLVLGSSKRYPARIRGQQIRSRPCSLQPPV